jgi:hypothetical protein
LWHTTTPIPGFPPGNGFRVSAVEQGLTLHGVTFSKYNKTQACSMFY